MEPKALDQSLIKVTGFVIGKFVATTSHAGEGSLVIVEPMGVDRPSERFVFRTPKANLAILEFKKRLDHSSVVGRHCPTTLHQIRVYYGRGIIILVCLRLCYWCV